MNKLRKIFLVSIFIGLLSSPLFFAHAQDNPAPDLGASTPKVSPPIDFPTLSVHLPGLNFDKAFCTNTECSNNWLAEYIEALYKYGISIIGILAVITMMIGGILWLTAAGNDQRIADAKKWVGGSLMGVLIALTSYIILNMINPALTQLSPLQINYIPKTDLEEISIASYKEITGGEPMKSFGPEMMQLIKKISQERNLDSCFLYTFVLKESDGRVNVIGHDENVNKVKSNVAYIQSGKTFKGLTFSSFIKNDDTPVCPDKEDLCLDWRFSHGIGLVQITILPRDNIKKNGTFAKKIKGRIYSPRELFLPETSLNAAADYLEESGCGTNLSLCFKKYNGSNAIAEQYSKEAIAIYNECKKNNGPQ